MTLFKVFFVIRVTGVEDSASCCVVLYMEGVPAGCVVLLEYPTSDTKKCMDTKLSLLL